MTNYLEHLVGRSQGDANQVKPLLPTRFEPSPGIGGLGKVALESQNADEMTDPHEQIDDWAQSSQSFQGQDVERSTRSQQLSPLPYSFTQATSYSTNIFSEAESRANQGLPQSPVQPSVISSNSLPLDLPAFPHQPPILQHQVDIVPPASTSSVLNTYLDEVDSTQEVTPSSAIKPNLSEHTTSLKDRVVQPVTSTSTPNFDQESGDIRPVVKSITPPSATVATEKVSLVRPVGAMAPNLSLAPPTIRSLPAEPIAPSQKEAPAPTINVTIGRIEVRATPSVPAQVKPKSTSSVMSLDEYLRKRGGGI